MKNFQQNGLWIMPRGSPRLRTSEDKKNQVGDRVRQRCNELKLTQDALCGRLADETGGAWVADRRDIYRIQSGSRIVSDLEVFALAMALECEVCWLMQGNNPEPIRFLPERKETR